MLGSQEAISIPVAYIETFVMIFVSFLIGYIGACLYGRVFIKKQEVKYKSRLKQLNTKLESLQDELDRKEDSVFKKERMDEEFDHVQVINRAFSDEVILKKVVEREHSEYLDFTRIGIASAKQRNELQEISGLGPYTEAKLNELGIFTFDQISRFNKEDIDTVTKLIKFFPDRIQNDRWVDKAKHLKKINLEEKSDPDDFKKKKVNKKTTY